MDYTIKIRDGNKKARSIINMLKALKEDFNFIEITENQTAEQNVVAELEQRYLTFLKNPEGKDWEQLRQEICY